MKDILVGYTGFVGSNLVNMHKFSACYNSKNIKEAFGTNPDLCVYAGLRAEKYLANKFPNKDFENIKEAIQNIKKINSKKIVLISTIDVLAKPYGDEDSQCFSEEAYGRNRRYLEEYIIKNFNDYLIIRLPGLFGLNLKKNFIYDYLNQIPQLLNNEKFLLLSNKSSLIKESYDLSENGFYCLKAEKKGNNSLLKEFKKLNFSSLNFTDSRGLFQYYNLSFLWFHINVALKNNLKILNIATEPISSNEIYHQITKKDFENKISNNVPEYNMVTKHYKLFGGTKGYIFNKEFVLKDIERFVLNKKFNMSVSNIAWLDKDDDKFLEVLSNNHEINYLEIAPNRIIKNEPYDHLKDAKKIITNYDKKYGLKISSMQSIWFGRLEKLFSNNEKEFDFLLDYTKKCIDFASEIGCSNIVFGCPKNRILSSDNDYIKALKFFKIIGKYSLKKKAIIAIEPNPKIYGTNFLNTTKDAIDFCKKINLSSIKLNLDLGTVIANKENLDDIFKNFNYINHIHFSRPYLKGFRISKIYIDCIKHLITKGYKKCLSLEVSNKTKNLEKVIYEFSRLNYF